MTPRRGKKADGLVNLYCWAHIRRYFVRAGDANPAQLKYWATAWCERIKDLYAAHEELMTAWAAAADPAPQEAAAAAARLKDAHAAWDAALGVIDAARRHQMTGADLHQAAKKALATLDREWDWLAAHRGYPMISLDNNAAERALRRPVMTRKNAYGSRTGDAARLAARVWTVTATAEMAGLKVITYLTAHLDACGRHGGKPLSGPDLEPFLPWNAAPADLHAWAQPPRPANPHDHPAAANRHECGRAARPHACSPDFRILTWPKCTKRPGGSAPIQRPGGRAPIRPPGRPGTI